MTGRSGRRRNPGGGGLRRNASAGGLRRNADRGPMKERHRRFIQAYLIHASRIKAAIAAGYPPSRAQQSSWRLLQNPEISMALHAALAARARRTGITAERVLEELARIAFADMRRIACWSRRGTVALPHHLLSEDDAAAIEELAAEGDDASHVRIRLFDKRPALAILARHLRLAARERGADDAGESLRRRLDALAGRGGGSVEIEVTTLPSSRV